MSLLKRINWKTLVPMFLLVVMLPCYLLNVEKLGASTLTSKAFTNTWQRVFTYWRLGSQFNYYNDYKVYTRIQLDPSANYYKHCARFCFNGTTTNGDELEYFVRVYNYGSYSNPITESEWLDSNTWVQGFDIYAPKGASHPDQTLECWVRRKDGGILTPSSLNYTMVSFDTLCDEQVELPTNPDSWYETTTQSIPSYTTQTTMVTTVDYEGYLSTLTIPVDVRPAIATLDQLINDLWSLHYIPFVVCFALIMGLAIWLLH